jgi:DNA-binding NarL/FixJ family response regulator
MSAPLSLSSQNITLLFVDDEPRILSGLKRQFYNSSHPWTLHFESEPLKALEDCLSLRPDIVITDYRMPKMDGVELVLAMRHHLPDTRFIMLTGSDELAVAMKAINEARIDSFLVKPCDKEDLEQAIEDSQSRIEQSRQAFVELTRELATHALLIVNDAMQITMTTDRAQTVLRKHEGLIRQDNGYLKGSSDALNTSIRKAIDASGAKREAVFFQLCKEESETSLMVKAKPLRSASSLGRHFALFLIDWDVAHLPEPQILMDLFGLSMTESMLALGLASGLTLQDAAEECHLTHSSARTYLKRIFEKMMINKQNDLVKIILSIPPENPSVSTRKA